MGTNRKTRGPFSEDEVRALCERIEQRGGAKLSEVTAGLSPGDRMALFEQLERRGFERNTARVHLPLEPTLLERVEQCRRVSFSELVKDLPELASKKDLDAAAKRLAREGKLALAKQGRTLWLTTPDQVLSREQVAALRTARERIQDALKPTVFRKNAAPSSVFPDKILATVRELESALRGHLHNDIVPATQGQTPPSQDAFDVVLRAVRELAAAGDPVVFVPALMERLAGSVDRAAAHQAIFDAARTGKLELRQEAGTTYLQPQQLEACPQTTEGTYIAYVREIRS